MTHEEESLKVYPGVEEIMYSYVMPDLNKWFEAGPYDIHQECRFLEVRMKRGLNLAELKELYLALAKYICSIRCPSEELYNIMVDAMQDGKIIDASHKNILQNCFSNGFIKEEEFKRTGSYRASFDNDAIKGYLGEAFYYLIRDNFVEDKKISIEPVKPKNVSKTPGIDFLEVRKDAEGFYFVIGEVKTTENSYSDRNAEVIKSFLERIDRNFSEIYMDLRARDDGTDKDYTKFLEIMLDDFYSYTGSNHKRLAGVFNYNYSGKKIPANAFSTWKDQPFDINNNPICRRIKVIGIYEIEQLVTNVRDMLWNVL